MAKCWTCGSSVSDLCYRCSACEDALRDIESSVSEGFAGLAEIQERGFKQLSADLSEIATILEWGFEELSWQLHQQTEVLRSIDHTLKTPSETKANEWRLHAEELRRRGVLEESEEFFLKALNEYRLDYRIYVGLAETYLQMNKFDKAKSFLEKSLPHVPKGGIEVSEGTRKIKDLLQQGKKIEAIREYRAQTEVGLVEAKDAVERMAAGEDIRLSSAKSGTASDLDEIPDEMLINYLANEFYETEGIDLRKDPIAYQRLKEAAKKAKCDLSTQPETTIILPFITANTSGPKHLQITLTRSKFETLAKLSPPDQDVRPSSVRGGTALDFDWKSYSYRLLGHIYACEEDHIKALEALHLAIKLSPDYTDGLYDFAQYISLVNDDVVEHVCSKTLQEWGGNWALKNYNLLCLLALQKAIKAKPVYFYLAQKEKNFDHRRKHVELALKNLLDNACGRVESIDAKINCTMEEIDKAISEAKRRFRDAELESGCIYEDAKSKLKLAKDKVASGDYLKILEAEKIANESHSLFEKSKDKACSEQDQFNDIVKSEFDFGVIAVMSAVGAFLLGIGGCILNVMAGFNDIKGFTSAAFPGFFIIAIVITLYKIYNIYIKKPLFKKSED